MVKGKKRRTKKKSFEHYIEERFEEFGEDMENLGMKISKHAERKSKKHKKIFGPWDFIWPFIASLIGLVFLSFLLFVLNSVNHSVQNIFVASIANFVYISMNWFFIAFLFFGYVDYFSKAYKKSYWVIDPIVKTGRVYFGIWLSVWVLKIVNLEIGNDFIYEMSSFLSVNTWEISLLFLILFYIIAIFKRRISN